MTSIRIFGEAGRYCGSYNDDGTHNGYTLKPCPFCGGEELEICNTHSPIFWIDCTCGAQMLGEHNDDAEKAQTEEAARVAFEAAMASAVEDWNTRPG